MKKFIAASMAAAMAVSLAACGSSSSSTAPAASTGAASTGAASTSAEAGAPAASLEGFSTEGLTYNYSFPASEDFENAKIDCSADDAIELSLGCSGTITGTVNGDAVEFAQQVVEQATDGKVKIVLYEGGTLGSDTEMMEGMQMGSVDMFTGSPSGQVSMVPNLAVLDIGGAFTSIDNCNQVLGNFVELIQGDYNSKGLQIMGCYATDWRLLTSNKEYTSVADMSGSTVRVQENPYHIAFWKALGANPTPLAFGEVYLSLQQGMLDAQENPYGSIIGAKLYEVQDYLYESDHIPFISTDVISTSKYNSLSAAQQQAINQFCYAKEYYILQHASEAIAEELQICQDGGMTYVAEMPADILAMYPTAAQSVIDTMKSSGVDATFLSDYVASVNAVEGTNFTV